MSKIPLSYYLHPDVVFLAKDLIGKYLLTFIDGNLTGGMITETEAYKGPEDRASHAYNNRRTKRTEVMFQKGGIAYVYLIYGMYSLLNIVTNDFDIPHAILIRAIKPEIGVDIIKERRCHSKNLTDGPGTLSKALGITKEHNGIFLNGKKVWLEDRNITFEESQIKASPRIGIDYAGQDALLPWRFTAILNSNCNPKVK